MHTGDVRAMAEIARRTSRSSVRGGGGTTLEFWETVIVVGTSVVNDNTAGGEKVSLDGIVFSDCRGEPAEKSIHRCAFI